jgi:hypothetical protein
MQSMKAGYETQIADLKVQLFKMASLHDSDKEEWSKSEITFITKIGELQANEKKNRKALKLALKTEGKVAGLIEARDNNDKKMDAKDAYIALLERTLASSQAQVEKVCRKNLHVTKSLEDVTAKLRLADRCIVSSQDSQTLLAQKNECLKMELVISKESLEHEISSRQESFDRKENELQSSLKINEDLSLVIGNIHQEKGKVLFSEDLSEVTLYETSVDITSIIQNADSKKLVTAVVEEIVASDELPEDTEVTKESVYIITDISSSSKVHSSIELNHDKTALMKNKKNPRKKRQEPKTRVNKQIRTPAEIKAMVANSGYCTKSIKSAPVKKSVIGFEKK